MSALSPQPKFPSFKFETKGTEFRGVVTQPPMDSQAVKYNPDASAPKVLDFWPDGNPKMQTRIVARLADGNEYAIYASGRMARAITAAIVKAGASDIEVGSEISVKWSDGDGRAGSPKQFESVYVKGAAAAPDYDDEPPF